MAATFPPELPACEGSCNRNCLICILSQPITFTGSSFLRRRIWGVDFLGLKCVAILHGITDQRVNLCQGLDCSLTTLSVSNLF